MRARLFALACPLLLASCVRYPEPFRPPAQRGPLELEKPESLRSSISMRDSTAPMHFVSDIVPELHDDAWRWTLKKPAFRFQLSETQGVMFELDYTVPDLTIKQTGPVNITVSIDGHRLGVIHVERDQKTVWRKAVPPGMLTTSRPVIVQLEIDKMWVADHHEMERGFIISNIGFTS